MITLFGGIGLQQRGAARLRAATTVQEVRLWMGLLRPTGRMLPSAVALLLGSGLYMTAQAWSLSSPFVAVGIVTVLVMAVVGAGILGRRFAAIGRASAAAGDGPIPPELGDRIRAPGAWIALSAVNGAALAVVWLMTKKPGWGASVGVVVAATAIGGAIGALVSRAQRSRRSASVSAASEERSTP